MKFDLAFVLIDLDEPLYRVAASEMIRSARRAYKDHDMRVVQLTDNRSAHHPDVDGVFSLDTDVKGANFCQMKGFVMAEYALKADRPVIFCDVDLIWNNDGIARFWQKDEVRVLERGDMPAMPYNTGVVTTPPEVCRAFWEDYRKTCEHLPAEVCAWYGDQFAMLATVSRFIGEVDTMNMDAWAPAIDELPAAPLDSPAVHFKGDRKRLMAPYARMLDKGAGFEFVRPNVNDQVHKDMERYRREHAEVVAHAEVQYREGFTF